MAARPSRPSHPLARLRLPCPWRVWREIAATRPASTVPVISLCREPALPLKLVTYSTFTRQPTIGPSAPSSSEIARRRRAEKRALSCRAMGQRSLLCWARLLSTTARLRSARCAGERGACECDARRERRDAGGHAKGGRSCAPAQQTKTRGKGKKVRACSRSGRYDLLTADTAAPPGVCCPPVCARWWPT